MNSFEVKSNKFNLKLINIFPLQNKIQRIGQIINILKNELIYYKVLS